MKRRIFLSAVLLVNSLMIGTFAQAQVQGKEYVPISPALATDSPGKIEVLEFFSYGCIHCYRLHPHAKRWEAKAPADVVFKRVPVTFDRPQMRPMAKLFYALEATGDLARLDDAVFAAVHDYKIVLATDEAVTKWVAAQGVEAKKFADAYNSMGVRTKVARAEQLTKSYRVQGTPQVFVDGRYAIQNEVITAGGREDYGNVFMVTDKVLLLARKAK